MTSVDYHAGRLTILCEAQAHRIERLEHELESVRRVLRKTELWAVNLVDDLRKSEREVRVLKLWLGAEDEPLNVVPLHAAGGGR